MTVAPSRPPRRPVGRPPAPRPPVDARVQRHRRLRFAAVLARARVRLSVVPPRALRHRQRVQVCSAARLLTALGVRVRVVQPQQAWPRDRALWLVPPDEGWLAGLAVLTAVPRATPGWSVLADRLFRSDDGTAGRDAPAGALRCRVTVHVRCDAGDLTVVPRTAAGVAAVRGLVVEVRLLPAEQPASHERAGALAA